MVLFSCIFKVLYWLWVQKNLLDFSRRFFSFITPPLPPRSPSAPSINAANSRNQFTQPTPNQPPINSGYTTDSTPLIQPQILPTPGFFPRFHLALYYSLLKKQSRTQAKQNRTTLQKRASAEEESVSPKKWRKMD